jgi:hypothetical protein
LTFMTNAEDRRSYRTERLGEVLRRVAGKLAAQRKGEATPQDAASRLPTVKEVLTGGASAVGVAKGLAARDPIQRAASAGPVRKAMQASGGK